MSQGMELLLMRQETDYFVHMMLQTGSDITETGIESRWLSTSSISQIRAPINGTTDLILVRVEL